MGIPDLSHGVRAPGSLRPPAGLLVANHHAPPVVERGAASRSQAQGCALLVRFPGEDRYVQWRFLAVSPPQSRSLVPRRLDRWRGGWVFRAQGARRWVRSGSNPNAPDPPSPPARGFPPQTCCLSNRGELFIAGIGGSRRAQRAWMIPRCPDALWGFARSHAPRGRIFLGRKGALAPGSLYARAFPLRAFLFLRRQIHSSWRLNSPKNLFWGAQK